MKTSEQILEDIFDYGKSLHEFNIGKKCIIKIRNITTEDFMSMDNALKDNTMTQLGLSQTYILERISRVIVEINSNKFATVEACQAYLKKMPSSFSDKILAEHKKFENAIKKAMELEEIEEAFFDKGTSPENLKQ